MISRFAFEVIFTHDLHSQFDNWPKVVTTIKSLIENRKALDQPYLLVDVGDHIDRAHFISEGTFGRANVALLNEMAYDYVTIGNNEGITLDYPQLSGLYQEAGFKVLINNLFDKEGTHPPWCLPYDVKQIGEFTVGIIGTTVNFTRFYEQLGWRIEDPFEAVRENVSYLRDKVDFILLLSHLGLPRDQQLAEQIPGIDLILGAHTHHFLPKGLQIGNTWIHQVGKFGQYVGRVEIYYQSDRHTFSCLPKVEEVEGRSPDKETLSSLEAWRLEAEKHLAQPVTVLDQELEIDWDQETVLANLLAEAVSDWCRTPIAVVNAGLILDHLPRGEVTLKDLHHICPHPINACRLTLTGQELTSILHRSIEPSMLQLEVRGLGFRGKRLGLMALNGLEVYYSQTEEGCRIVEIMTESGPLEADREYTVATIDMFTFSKLFPELHGREETEYFMPDFLRDLLAKRFQGGHLERAKHRRWVKYPIEQKEA